MSGVLKKLSFPEYLAAPGANFSTLRHFARTPAHARELMLHPPAPTAAQELGQALHCAILEPERFAKEYAVGPATMIRYGEEMPLDRRTKEGKATWKIFEVEHPGAEILSADDDATIRGIQNSVLTHPFASELIQRAKARELCVFWEAEVEPYGAILCKARLDIAASEIGDWTFVADVKSVGSWVADASPKGFSKAVSNHLYHAQAAMYLDALDAVSEHPRRFVWIAAESERPYLVACYEPDDQALEQGRRLYQAWLYQCARCQSLNQWDGYDPGCSFLALQPWAVVEV